MDWIGLDWIALAWGLAGLGLAGRSCDAFVEKHSGPGGSSSTAYRIVVELPPRSRFCL